MNSYLGTGCVRCERIFNKGDRGDRGGVFLRLRFPFFHLPIVVVGCVYRCLRGGGSGSGLGGLGRGWNGLMDEERKRERERKRKRKIDVLYSGRLDDRGEGRADGWTVTGRRRR